MSCYPAIKPPTWLSYFTAITSCILCVVVISGNSLVILSVILDPLRRLRTPFSYFLVNLAVTDFIVGTISLPVAAYSTFQEVKRTVPQYVAILVHVTYFIPSTVSVLSLGALCVDRYTAIRWPFRYRQKLSLKRCLAITASIWVFSVAISSLYRVIGFLRYLMVFVHVSIFLTFVIVVLTYRQVYKTLRDQTNRMQYRENGRQSVQRRYNVIGSEINSVQRRNNLRQRVTKIFEYGNNTIEPEAISVQHGYDIKQHETKPFESGYNTIEPEAISVQHGYDIKQQETKPFECGNNIAQSGTDRQPVIESKESGTNTKHTQTISLQHENDITSATHSAENMSQRETESEQCGNNVLQPEATEVQPIQYIVRPKRNEAKHCNNNIQPESNAVLHENKSIHAESSIIERRNNTTKPGTIAMEQENNSIATKAIGMSSESNAMRFETTPTQHVHYLKHNKINPKGHENHSIEAEAIAMPCESNAIQLETTAMQRGHNLKLCKVNAEEHLNNSMQSEVIAMQCESNSTQPEATPVQHLHNLKQNKINAGAHEKNPIQAEATAMLGKSNAILPKTTAMQDEYNVPQPGGATTSAAMLRERKVTKAFVLILSLFVCCYAPTVIMVYILQFCPKCGCAFRHTLRDFQFVFVWANSAMNPVICVATLSAFRKSIFALLGCRGWQSRQRPNLTAMTS